MECSFSKFNHPIIYLFIILKFNARIEFKNQRKYNHLMYFNSKLNFT
jgi:hypothetical protein